MVKYRNTWLFAAVAGGGKLHTLQTVVQRIKLASGLSADLKDKSIDMDVSK